MSPAGIITPSLRLPRKSRISIGNLQKKAGKVGKNDLSSYGQAGRRRWYKTSHKAIANTSYFFGPMSSWRSEAKMTLTTPQTSRGGLAP
jgi:hypothetical protein